MSKMKVDNEQLLSRSISTYQVIDNSHNREFSVFQRDNLLFFLTISESVTGDQNYEIGNR